MFKVGERIRHFREERGLTINALANLAGISQSYLRELELGNKNPTVEYLEYICDALKISLVTFFDLKNEASETYKSIDSLSEKQKKRLIEFIESMK
jgi:transcriptional regulator with XRE-family HTH domain